MNHIARLHSNNGNCTSLGYDFSSSIEELVQRGDVDCCIVSTEDGFSPLGASRQFFSNELGVAEEDIRTLANWNRFDNPNISLVCLRGTKINSNLKGVVLAASETSQCYEQFARPFHDRPYRDFYYNVAYESIAHSAKVFGARKIAMTHLSGSGNFHEDIAICVAEALAHFCDIDDSPKIDSFLFVGCCIDPRHLYGIQILNPEGNQTAHRKIQTRSEQMNGHEVISLDWRCAR